MNRLTREERHGLYLAQQRARESMLARLSSPLASAAADPGAEVGKLRRVVRVMVLAALLAGSFLAARMLELHPPASLVEALLPRV